MADLTQASVLSPQSSPFDCEARMTLHDDYEQALAAWRTARSQVLSDRLTLSRKTAQMHEADVEQDDEVAEYFAGRMAEMQERVAVGEAHVTELAAAAEEVRITMVTQELDATLDAYREALRAMEAHIAALAEQARQVTTLSQRAESLAETLPASAEQQHRAAEIASESARTIEAALEQLRGVMSEPPTS